MVEIEEVKKGMKIYGVFYTFMERQFIEFTIKKIDKEKDKVVCKKKNGGQKTIYEKTPYNETYENLLNYFKSKKEAYKRCISLQKKKIQEMKEKIELKRKEIEKLEKKIEED